MKACTKCHEPKDTAEFYKQSSYRGRASRYQSICKKCVLTNRKNRYATDTEFRSKTISKVKNWQQNNWLRWKDKDLKNRYSISLDEYTVLLEQQGGLCAICHEPESRQIKGVTCSLHVDHDHSTGKIRGLLCHGCNTGIGLLKEDITVLHKAIAYLSSNQSHLHAPTQPSCQKYDFGSSC